jgi:hypothetical protein
MQRNADFCRVIVEQSHHGPTLSIAFKLIAKEFTNQNSESSETSLRKKAKTATCPPKNRWDSYEASGASRSAQAQN